MNVLDRLDEIAAQQDDHRYRILEKLGQGGMGQVFLAEKLGPTGEALKTVVLKTVIPQGDDPKQAQRLTELFLSEMKVSAGLEHRNVVRVTDWGDDLFGHTTFLEMERIKGISLVDLVAARGAPLEEEQKWGPLPPLLVAWLGMQIFHGIKYAHNHKRTGEDDTMAGVVHRDLSLDNVMGDVDGEVKIIDWGIAKVADANGDVSRTGMIAGKLKYMPPEQLNGRIELRSDYYAAGVLLTAALIGRDVFDIDGLAFEAAAMRVLQGDRASVHALAPDAPKELQDLLEQLMQKDSKLRPASAAETADRFKNILIKTLGTDLHSAQTAFAECVREHHKEGKRTKRMIDSAPGGPSKSHRRPISKGTARDRPGVAATVALDAGSSPSSTSGLAAAASETTATLQSSRRPLLLATLATLMLVLLGLVGGVVGFLFGGFGDGNSPASSTTEVATEETETPATTQPPAAPPDEPAVTPPEPSPEPDATPTASAGSEGASEPAEEAAATLAAPEPPTTPETRRGRRREPPATPRVRTLGGASTPATRQPQGRRDLDIYGI